MPNPSSPSPLLPVAPATRRRRRLLASPNPSSAPASSSSSASSSSTSSSASFSFPSPAPSPFHHRFFSPLRASAVPFSWEHRPGIPKTPARGPSTRSSKLGASTKAPPLPLPPSLFSNNRVGEYPFDTAAYSVVVPDKARRRGPRKQQRRWPAVTGALADWLAVLSLYRSCTKSRDCLAAAGPPPQPRRRVPA